MHYILLQLHCPSLRLYKKYGIDNPSVSSSCHRRRVIHVMGYKDIVSSASYHDDRVLTREKWLWGQ
jgi:hypothetical protein